MRNPELVAFSAAGVETIGAAAPPQWLEQFARMRTQEHFSTEPEQHVLKMSLSYLVKKNMLAFWTLSSEYCHERLDYAQVS